MKKILFSLLCGVTIFISAFCFGDNASIVRNKIKKNCRYPTNLFFTPLAYLNRDGWCKVKFTVLKDGSVKDIKITHNKCELLMLAEAEKAILKSAPFPHHDRDTTYVVKIDFKYKLER